MPPRSSGPAKASSSTKALICAFVLLVAGPIFIPSEVARWYVAAAGNALRLKSPEAAQRYLETATKWDAQLEKQLDFWLVKLSQPGGLSPLAQFEVLEKAIATNPRLAKLARAQLEDFADLGAFDLALRALKLSFTGREPSTPTDFNDLAYFRALADVELDKALENILTAKTLIGGDAALDDTHAWVLHKLNRNLEALGLANSAVEGLRGSDGLLGILSGNSAEKPETSSSEPPGDQAAATEPDESGDAAIISPMAQIRKQVGRKVWTEGVIRFHRLRILESLGRAQATEEDRRWLVEHHIPITDLIY